MSKKKNQHYVPQFHLREWSDDGKLISLYNKYNSIYVDNKGAIKNLASKNHLYDKDGSLENVFGTIEATIAPICKKIIKSQSLSELSEFELEAVYFHAIMCNERTAAAGEDFEEMMLTTLQTSLRMYQAHGRYTEIDVDTIKDKLYVDFPCSKPILAAIKYYPLILDLKISLIKNTSNVDFLTSDYPTIRYNLWSLKRGLYSGWGMSSVGIMYILPISPKLALMIYDQVVYKIKNLRNNTVSIKNDSEINELNKLMFLNSNENLFFSSNVPLHYIKKIESSIKSYIKSPKPVTVLGNTEGFFIANSTRRISYKANLNFLTILKESLEWYVPSHAAGLSRPTSEEIAKEIGIKLD